MSSIDKTYIIQQLAGKQAKTRFAPSPTGYLHLGHILSALYVWGVAKHLGGKVVLRIENHDRGRSQQRYIDAIIDDLDRMGFLDADQLQNILYQSDYETQYQTCYNQLKKDRQLFSCLCGRNDLDPSPKLDSERYYPNKCTSKNLAFNDKRSHRLSLQNKVFSFQDLVKGQVSQNPDQLFGALVLKDRTQNWTYIFSSLVDDVTQGINIVIRGEDLLHVTSRQLDLKEQLGRPDHQSLFLHHRLIYDTEGKKLSKRNLATRAVDKHTSPRRLTGQLAHDIGINPKNHQLSLTDFSELLFAD